MKVHGFRSQKCTFFPCICLYPIGWTVRVHWTPPMWKINFLRLPPCSRSLVVAAHLSHDSEHGSKEVKKKWNEGRHRKGTRGACWNLIALMRGDLATWNRSNIKFEWWMVTIEIDSKDKYTTPQGREEERKNYGKSPSLLNFHVSASRTNFPLTLSQRALSRTSKTKARSLILQSSETLTKLFPITSRVRWAPTRRTTARLECWVKI